MHFHLAGLRAVVADGASPLGAAIVRKLAAEGCHVDFCVAAGPRANAVLDSARGLPGKMRARLIDAADTPLLQDWLAEIEGFDILVPNIHMAPSDAHRAPPIDIRATVNAIESAIPLLRRSRHPVITYVGAASPQGISGAAMAHYMKALENRVHPTVRINTVLPGDTPGETHDDTARVVAFVSGPAARLAFRTRHTTALQPEVLHAG